MSGSDKQKGVIEMAVDDIFSLIEEVYTDSIFILRVSCMELYNETVYDLLADKKLEVREKDNNFIVKDVDEKYISYPEEILKFIKAANDKRQVGATAMNDKSSRSHAIYRIVIEGKQVKENLQFKCNVNNTYIPYLTTFYFLLCLIFKCIFHEGKY